MRIENGYYIDDNNNKWNIDRYTEQEATEYSENLTDCRDCTDCKNCKSCLNCSDSVNCHNL